MFIINRTGCVIYRLFITLSDPHIYLIDCQRALDNRDLIVNTGVDKIKEYLQNLYNGDINDIIFTYFWCEEELSDLFGKKLTI